MEPLHLVILIVSVAFTAFFSGMEIAFITANKLRIEIEKKQHSFSARIISIFLKRPAQYIATMMVGNNIALVLYGIVMAIIIGKYLSGYLSSGVSIFILQTVISTIIILFTGEFIPKALFRLNPNSALRFFSIPLLISFIVLYPISVFTIFLSNSVIGKMLGIEINNKNNMMVFGKYDLDQLLSESLVEDRNAETEIDDELKLFQNALDFSNVKLRECMVPRTELEAIELNEPIDELKKKFIETGFSKILVFENNIDNIIGYFHISEFFNSPKDIQSRIILPLFVPETMAANKLLRMFIQQHKSIAVVVDEFGGTAGIVTIEDIMEEIFGEIEDEHDVIEYDEKQLSENEFLFSGRLEIDYLNEKYNLHLPESDDYETIAGFILFNHNNIPKVDTVLTIPPYEISIIKVSETRIELVKIKINTEK